MYLKLDTGYCRILALNIGLWIVRKCFSLFQLLVTWLLHVILNKWSKSVHWHVLL
jgi:hypothetical protein